MDYNSDDDETIVRDTEDPYAHLGQTLAKKLIDNVIGDRRESKKFILNLKPDFGVKATNAEYARWWNRWSTFRGACDKSHTFDQPPSMELLERFLVTITNNANTSGISKRRDSGVPSLNWLRRGLRAVIVGLRFRHSKWRPDANAGFRFKAIMQQLYSEGKLTNDPIKIKQWLTVRLGIQLANAYLSKALTSKVRSWDVVIMRLLSWVLQSAVDGRAGDVTLTKTYVTHFLKWEDIEFQLGKADDVSTLDGLKVMVTLKNSKGYKDDPFHNTSKLLEPLDNLERNASDVVNLLLIHGLRTRVFVGGETLPCIFAYAAEHNNRRLAIHAKALPMPVICQIETSGSRLLLDKAATTPQMNKSLQDAGDAYGLTSSLTTHDIKRGFVRDYIYAPEMRGAARPDVAYAASHTLTAMAAGVTQAYAGPRADSGYTHRHNNLYEDKTESFRISVSQTHYTEKRLTTQEIDAELLPGEDPDDTKARGRATGRIKKRRRAEFYGDNEKEGNKRKKPGPLAMKPANTNHVEPSTNQEIAVPIRKLSAYQDDADDSLFVNQDSLDFLAAHTEDTEEREFYGTNDVDTLFRSLNESGDTVVDQNPSLVDDVVSSMLQSTEVSDDLLAVVEPADLALTPADLMRPAAEFISLFSKIQAVGEHLRENREHPVGSGKYSWFIKCPNQDLGCEEKMIGYSKIQNHYLVCPYNNPMDQPEPRLPCTHNGCGKTFKHAQSLKTHLKSHLWVPQQCANREQCGINTVFPSSHTLGTHRHQYHGRFKATCCTYEGCQSEKVYDQYTTLKLHLKTEHQLVSAAEQNVYVYPKVPRMEQNTTI